MVKVTMPRTSPLAMLVGSYGVIHSRSLRSCDPCFARLYMYLMSLCLKKIFCLPPTPSACSHSPYIFHAENTRGETVTVRDMKIAPTEIFCGGNACFKRYFLHYSTTLAVAPLLRWAIYTPAGRAVVSIVAVVAPCRTACTATARPVAS